MNQCMQYAAARIRKYLEQMTEAAAEDREAHGREWKAVKKINVSI